MNVASDRERRPGQPRSERDAAFLKRHDTWMQVPIIVSAILPLVIVPTDDGWVGAVVGVVTWLVFLVDYVVHMRHLVRGAAVTTRARGWPVPGGWARSPGGSKTRAARCGGSRQPCWTGRVAGGPGIRHLSKGVRGRVRSCFLSAQCPSRRLLFRLWRVLFRLSAARPRGLATSARPRVTIQRGLRSSA